MIPEKDCTRCTLFEHRTQIVMPSGDLNSKVAFVGEAPGENEDFWGKPFVGKSGKLLDRLLQEEGLPRSKIMITNTVKCRPPNNRDPTAEEMTACRPFLEYELRSKELVICLGKSACRSLLGYEGKMGAIVNTRMEKEIGGRMVTVIPTYHPAACIYNRDSMESLKETIRTVRAMME